MPKENSITTIKISQSTKSRLDHLKEYKRESYNEILEKIINILNLVGKNPALANRALKDLDRKIKGKLRYTVKPQLNESKEIIKIDTEENKKQIIKPIKPQIKLPTNIIRQHPRPNNNPNNK